MIQRTFIPGDRWLYFKIYTGIHTADMLLKDIINPLVTMLVDNKIIQKWHFLRYNDHDGFHIRIRFLMTDSSQIQFIVEEIYKSIITFINSGVVFRLVFDTYIRELERYGESVYENTETIFCIDSDHILKCLDYIANNNCDDNLKWMCAIAMLNDTFEASQIQIQEKKRISENCRDSYRKEYEVVKPEFIRIFDRKYRKDKYLVENSILYKSFPSTISNTLSERKQKIKDVFKSSTEIPILKEYDISSINHMTCNRLFTESNRQCELTIYEYLSRYYSSEIAKKKYSK